MPKPGIVKLPANIYPKLQDKYTEHELKHILVLTAMDINNVTNEIEPEDIQQKLNDLFN